MSSISPSFVWRQVLPSAAAAGEQKEEEEPLQMRRVAPSIEVSPGDGSKEGSTTTTIFEAEPTFERVPL